MVKINQHAIIHSAVEHGRFALGATAELVVTGMGILPMPRAFGKWLEGFLCRILSCAISGYCSIG